MSGASDGGRARFWEELIGRQQRSGLNVARFCKRVGVSANSFYVWKRRLRAPDAEPNRGQGASLVPVRLIADGVSRKALQSGTIEVEWPNGVVLRMSAGVDVGTLRDVLDTLKTAIHEERPSC